MNFCVSRTGNGGWPRCCLSGVVIATVMVGISAEEASAKALTAEACAALEAELQVMVADGLVQTVEKGPEWGRANLDPAGLERVRQFLSLEERILFQCKITDRKPPARVAKKGSKRTKGIPLPVPKPGRETTTVAAAVNTAPTVRTTTSQHLGAIAPAMPRAVIALPHLSATVAPLPGLRSGLEPAELVAKPRENGTGAKSEEGSSVATLDLRKGQPASPPAVAPEAKAPLIPLPVRNPLPVSVRKQAAKPRPVRRRAPPRRRVQQRAPRPQEALPSAASSFQTN